MTNNAFNPFMMPNFGQGASESATNPLIASMEMMRHAMAGMSAQSLSDATGSGMGAGPNFAQALNPEDIERRISELKVVENWLKLNLSMLTSTIQGLEVQLATIQTLKSFAAMGAQANEASQNMQKAWSESANSANSANTAGHFNAASTTNTPDTHSRSSSSAHPVNAQSPLEAALGMQPHAQAAAPAQPKVEAAKQTEETKQADIPPAGQAWWNMLEKQFSNIATATQEAAQVANDTGAELAKKAAANLAASTKPQVAAKSKPATKSKAATKAPTKTAAKSPTPSKAKSSKPSASKAAAPPRATSRSNAKPSTND
jgi:hypothetical protein